MKSEEPLDEAPKQTAKERLLEAKDKDIPLDLFLFSCFEQEQLLKATATSDSSGTRWPVLAHDETTENASYLNETSFEAVVQRMVGWYREHFPAMASRAPLNHEALPTVVPSMVALDKDLEKLHQSKLQSSLPLFLSPSTPPSAEWSVILSAVTAAFPNYSKFFVPYLQWSHGAEVVEEFVPGSRPPIGRYAPPPLRRDGPGGRRGSGGPSDRPGSKGPRSGRDGRSARPDQRPPMPKKGRDGQKSSDGRSRSPRRDHEDRPARRDRQAPPRPSESETQRLTEVALREVDEALGKLREDSSLQFVKLKPTNSFYRRVQHQKIVDSGFESSSVGEGADRAVQVTRKG